MPTPKTTRYSYKGALAQPLRTDQKPEDKLPLLYADLGVRTHAKAELALAVRHISGFRYSGPPSRSYPSGPLRSRLKRTQKPKDKLPGLRAYLAVSNSKEAVLALAERHVPGFRRANPMRSGGRKGMSAKRRGLRAYEAYADEDWMCDIIDMMREKNPHHKLSRIAYDLSCDKLLRQLTALAQLQCTQKEAARALCVSHRLLVQFLADRAEARQAWDCGRSLGRVSLRRLLWRQAQHNPAQARFLGKHWLGMDGKPHTTDDAPPVLSPEENIARIHELLAEARRRSNLAADHKTPDLDPSVIPPGDLEDSWSEALQDPQLPDDVLDSLELFDCDLLDDLQLADWDDLLGALDLGGLEDPGDSRP